MISRVAPLPAVTSCYYISSFFLLPLNKVYFQNFRIIKTDPLFTTSAERYIYVYTVIKNVLCTVFFKSVSSRNGTLQNKIALIYIYVTKSQLI